MNVVYALNSKYYELFIVSVFSLLTNNDCDEIFIFYNQLELEEIKEINTIQFIFETKINLIKINLKDLPVFKDFKLLHLTIETFYRLLIPQYVNKDKVLYLDVDTLIVGDLSKFYNIDISNYLFAARIYDSNNPYFAYKINELQVDHPYFNSGVMLFNLLKIVEEKYFSKVITWIKENPEKSDSQDEFVKTCDGRFLHLGHEFNWTTHAKGMNLNPLIIHFTGRYKPNTLFFYHPFSKIYNYYFKLARKKFNIQKKFSLSYLTYLIKRIFQKTFQLGRN